MGKTIQPSFSDKVLHFALPDAWELLTQEQLHYVLFALLRFTAIEVRTYLFIRMSGIKVLRHQADGWVCQVTTDKGTEVDFFLHTWQIESFSRCFDFVFESPRTPQYLHALGEFKAVNKLLRRHPHPEAVTAEHRLSSFLWFTAVKHQLMRYFPFLMKPAGEGESGEIPDMRAVMNAQIRALTGGDVTKEREVLSMDCWRALTELNEKAREQQEFNQKYGRN